MQIYPESLTRPSAPAMVGGRCHDDYLHGGVVELFSSEGSSSDEGGGGMDLRKRSEPEEGWILEKGVELGTFQPQG